MNSWYLADQPSLQKTLTDYFSRNESNTCEVEVSNGVLLTYYGFAYRNGFHKWYYRNTPTTAIGLWRIKVKPNVLLDFKTLKTV